ncbi:hypothetical protein [Chitinophaga sp. CF418]|uniref:hypothetical protein n=1 Tax=Chitinophaga sp. CF418 TaxID=1855287 RepID=UPI00091344B3|nr:hypothetical protein [Chitinophaga sp. CF418]SHN45760.1 hypothetical protein SAMN05216311_12161 [Chitinophaga sp. CF418]
MYKALHALLLVLTASCSAIEKNQQTTVQDTSTANYDTIAPGHYPPAQSSYEATAESSIEAGDSTLITGNFDGDNIPDSGYFVVVDKHIQQFDPKDYEHGEDNHMDSVTYDYKFCFRGEKLGTLSDLGGAAVTLINEGDINHDGKDEISVIHQYLLTGMGVLNSYTYQNGKWEEIATFEFGGYYAALDRIEAEGKIILKDSTPYFYENDDSPGDKLVMHK